MKYQNKLFLLILFLSLWLFPFFTHGITVEITATVPGCGDEVIGSGEQCDGSNLGGASCVLQGFNSGTLSCTSACIFNTAQCISDSLGGGGGGNNSIIPSIPSTNVVFIGRAYPRSAITLLKDAQVIATTVAGADANFQIAISGVSGGNYIFSVYSEDSKGVRSSLLTFPISVIAGVTTKVSGIFIAPTIALDKSEVRRGDNLVIFGQSVPAAEITISVSSEEEFFVKQIADVRGIYLLNFDTSVLEMGQHQTKSKSALNGEITAFGKVVGFIVGTESIVAELPKTISKGDINGDRRVNLVDFSVMAYWYKRASPPLSADFNDDGKVDLVDFSILAFNWTG